MPEGAPLPAPRNFPFRWPDPADAERYWVTDLLHNAYPRTPLVNGLADAFGRGMDRAYPRRGEPPPPPRRLTFNGYVYTEVKPGRAGPLPDLPPIDAIANWEQRVLPEVESITRPLMAFSPEHAPLGELVEHVPVLEGQIEQLGTLHHRAVMPSGVDKGRFFNFFIGRGVAPATVDAMLAGVETLSLASSRAQWQIGRIAAADPRTAAVVQDSPAGEIEARLQALGEPAAPLLAAADAHVHTFGWRPASLHPFALPVVEDHTPVWAAVKAAAAGGMADPSARHAVVAQHRQATLARVRGELAAEARDEFDRLHPRALAHTRIVEDHNVCIDQVVMALVHRACHHLALRLHEAGIVAGPHDAYFLELAELAALDRAKPDPPLQADLTRRRQEWERWCAYAPPLALGTRPADVNQFQDEFLGRVYEDTGNPRVLSGNGASTGVATGIARVLRDMSEADRLGPGDILVCITTLPPWTPLFARAGGVVAVSGGTLCHAAITAREFGIPAVLSVAGATTLIRDGQTITVDGTNGVVRLND